MPTAPTRTRSIRPRRGERPTRLRTVGELVRWSARRLDRAGLHFGHDTGNALDEAGALVFHALRLRHEEAAAAYGRALDPAGLARALQLVARRIEERKPSAYLTGTTWFAGHRIEVTEDVLVPRSPIAELCERAFAPWVRPERVGRVLDIGTGSGCIAIACAHAFPRAQVDAGDVSVAALAVAARNVAAHGLEARVHPILSDCYRGIGRRRYDIVVSNPPYVPETELDRLPLEYRREPRLGLAAGVAGLDVVEAILAGASRHLRPGGVLVVEVGNSQTAVHHAWPEVPFTWLSFERGGGGVLLLTAEQVHQHRRALARPRH